MKPTLLYIHGLYSDQYSRKFLNLKDYFKDEFDYDFMEWNIVSDINALISKKIEELKNVENLIIVGDSTGANYAYQFRDLRNVENDILILTSPLLDFEKLNNDFDFPEKIIPTLKKYTVPKNALIIATLKDEVVNQKGLLTKKDHHLNISLVSDNHRLQNLIKYIPEIRRYIFSHNMKQTYFIDKLPASDIEKLLKLNKELRNFEFKMKVAYQKIKSHKNTLLEQKSIDDFELEIELQLYTDNILTQKQFGVEDGDPFFVSKFVSPEYLENEEMFNMNWSEGADHDYEICYTMHHLIYDSFLSLETVLTTDTIWIDFNVQYQIFKNLEL